MSYPKQYDIDVNKFNRKFSSISFTDSNKNIDEKINKRKEFMIMCVNAISFNLVYNEQENIDKKMRIAEERFKKSTNIFDASIYDRMVFINKELFKVDCENIVFDKTHKKHYFIDNENNKIILDNTNSIGIVDLIKGPKNNEEWFIKHKMKSLPKKLQDLFQEESIVDRIYEDYKNNYNSDEKSDLLTYEKWNEDIITNNKRDKLIKKYILDNGPMSEIKNMPKVYYHYNHNWGSKKNDKKDNIGENFDRSRKRFILELDWSGISDKEHAGVSADRSYDFNQLKKNFKINYKRNLRFKKYQN